MHKDDFLKYKEEQAEKNYSNEGLVDLAADKFADILVRFMDKKIRGRNRIKILKIADLSDFETWDKYFLIKGGARKGLLEKIVE